MISPVEASPTRCRAIAINSGKQCTRPSTDDIFQITDVNELCKVHAKVHYYWPDRLSFAPVGRAFPTVVRVVSDPPLTVSGDQ